MILDVVGAVLQTPVAFRHVCHKKMLDEALRVFVEVSWELDLPLQNLLVDRHGVIVIEGIDPCDHFIR